MATTRTLDARTAAELKAIDRIVRKREFKESSVVFDRGSRYVAIPFTVKFGPDAGGWTLLIRTATDWSIRHRGEHDIEVFESLEYDAMRGIVTVKCLMDHMEAQVDALDVRLTCSAPENEIANKYEDLPPQFRKDVEELKRQRAEGRIRREHTRKRLAWRGVVAYVLYSMLLSTFAGGSAPVVLLVTPFISGAVSFLCIRLNTGPRRSAPFFGGVGFILLAAATASGGGSAGAALVLLCGTLLHIVGGIALLIWMREERSLRM